MSTQQTISNSFQIAVNFCKTSARLVLSLGNRLASGISYALLYLLSNPISMANNILTAMKWTINTAINTIMLIPNAVVNSVKLFDSLIRGILNIGLFVLENYRELVDLAVDLIKYAPGIAADIAIFFLYDLPKALLWDLPINAAKYIYNNFSELCSWALDNISNLAAKTIGIVAGIAMTPFMLGYEGCKKLFGYSRIENKSMVFATENLTQAFADFDDAAQVVQDLLPTDLPNLNPTQASAQQVYQFKHSTSTQQSASVSAAQSKETSENGPRI